MNNLGKRVHPDRSKIDMQRPREVWIRGLNISREELQNAVDKVGNSAAAVRKELGLVAASPT